jgi:predicted nicotinamide N-methyase
LSEGGAHVAGRVVLDLSCGLGLVPLALAAAGAARVVCSDRAHVLPAAAANIAANAAAVGAEASRFSFVPLDWTREDEAAAAAQTAAARGVDLIVSSDTLYNVSLHDALRRAALQLSVACGNADLVFAFEERFPDAEAAFFRGFAPFAAPETARPSPAASLRAPVRVVWLRPHARPPSRPWPSSQV